MHENGPQASQACWLGFQDQTRPRSFLVEAPPFGPPPPPTDCSVFEDEILGSDFHSIGFGSGNEYQVFDCVRKREAMCVLENSLGKWLNAASVDLPRLLGSDKSHDGLGSVLRTIQINVFNNFKCPGGGSAPLGKALRWVQFRALELGKAVRAWSRAPNWSSGIAARRRVADLVRATYKGGFARTLLNQLKSQCRNRWNHKIQYICIQINQLMFLTGIIYLIVYVLKVSVPGATCWQRRLLLMPNRLRSLT